MAWNLGGKASKYTAEQQAYMQTDEYKAKFNAAKRARFEANPSEGFWQRSQGAAGQVMSGWAPETIGAGIGAPPSLDLPAMQKAGQAAGSKQRKRTAGYAMLIEGQPGGAGINPPAVLNRARLLGY
jgi:hypothetical protein